MERRLLTREFTYNGIKLPPPTPHASPEETRSAYTTVYPELATAAIEGPEVTGDKMIYRFVRAVGTKG